jgi:short-subunit dehydrogenase
MKKQGFGQIINISSVLGKFATPGMAVYCASKFAVQGFSDSLRAELKRYGITVISICPTTTNTNFFKNMPSGEIKPNNPFMMSPEKVAKIILNASLKNKSGVVISLSGKFLSAINRLFPRLVRFILSKYTGKV